MICYFSACIFFLLQTFLPDFSGVVVLGFVLPFSLLIQMFARFENSNYLPNAIHIYFIFSICGILFIIPGMMPAEFLNTTALAMVAIFSYQLSKQYSIDNKFAIMSYFFSSIILWLSGGHSIALSFLALFFILQMRSMIILRIVIFFLLAIVSSFILYINNDFIHEIFIFSNWEAFQIQILFMNYQFIFFLTLLIYFILQWIIYLIRNSESPNLLKFGIYSIFFLLIFLFQSWIFSVFLFFSSLPKQSQGK